MGYRLSFGKRASSWYIRLLKDLRLPVAHQDRISRHEDTASHPRSSHVAAVCYRIAENQIEFLLVRTRTGRWTFPKGRVEGDPTRAAAAAREAFEEAGVFGRVESQPIASYLHTKREHWHFDEHLVDAHLCEVLRLVTPEELYRNPTWFNPDRAKRRLSESRKSKYASQLSNIVDLAIEQIRKSHPECQII